MNQNKKVLIVDDEPSLRKLMARLISLEGYTVVEADSLTTGKKMLQCPNGINCYPRGKLSS